MNFKKNFIYIILISFLGVVCLVGVYIHKANINRATANIDKIDSQKYKKTMSFEEEIVCQEYKEKALDDYKKTK